MYLICSVVLQTLLSLQLLLNCGYQNPCLSTQTPRWAHYQMFPTLLLTQSAFHTSSSNGLILLQRDKKLLLSIFSARIILSQKSKLEIKFMVDDNHWDYHIFDTVDIFDMLLQLARCCCHNLQYGWYKYAQENVFNLQCNIVTREAAGICWQRYLAFHSDSKVLSTLFGGIIPSRIC